MSVITRIKTDLPRFLNRLLGMELEDQQLIFG